MASGGRLVAVDRALLRRIAGGSGLRRVREVLVEGEVATATLFAREVPELRGHFPGRPVVPAVVMLDAMLQCSAALVAGRVDVSLRRATFRHPLDGAARVRLVVRREDGSFDACALRGDDVVAEALWAEV